MYAVSADFLETLSYSHVTVTRVSAYNSEGNPIPDCDDIPITDGSVTVDWGSLVRRTCTVTVGDWRYESLLQPYGTQLFIQKGVRFPNGQIVWCPLGYFRIESITDAWPKGAITITGVDRSRVISDYPFLHPDQPSTIASVAFEIQRLIASGFELPPTAAYYGGAVPLLLDQSSGAASVVYQNIDAKNPKVWMLGDSRWQGIADLALSVGCEVFFDPLGQPTLRRVPTIADSPIWRVASGDILVKTDIQITRANAYNMIVVNTVEDNATPVIVTASDDNPNSPTYIGTYGRVVYKYPKVVPPALASNVATTLLGKTKSLIREVSFTTVTNPALEAGDVITQIYPDGNEENFVVDSFSIPLGVTASMDVTTRSNAPDLS